MNKIILAFALILLAIGGVCQTNKEKAFQMGKEAIQLMDKGEPQKAIEMLKQCRELDPDDINYPYEIGYAYIMLKDYASAITIFETILTHKDANDAIYTMLGNTYDLNKQTDKAIATYEKGLTLFPKSGKLHLERGNIFLMTQEYTNALEWYEKGIKADPDYASNYYWACKIYLASTEKVWGMLYGEVFMNLERGSKRTEEISKLLFDTYKSQISFKGKNKVEVNFAQNSVINVGNLEKPEDLKLPFTTMVYEINLSIACALEKKISLETLNKIRSNFVDLYFQNETNKKYPNELMNYCKWMKDESQLECYNYWLLSQGDADGFEKWQKKNEEKWQKFLKWFSPNNLIITEQNYIHSSQY